MVTIAGKREKMTGGSTGRAIDKEFFSAHLKKVPKKFYSVICPVLESITLNTIGQVSSSMNPTKKIYYLFLLPYMNLYSVNR